MKAARTNKTAREPTKPAAEIEVSVVTLRGTDETDEHSAKARSEEGIYEG